MPSKRGPKFGEESQVKSFRLGWNTVMGLVEYASKHTAGNVTQAAELAYKRLFLDEMEGSVLPVAHSQLIVSKTLDQIAGLYVCYSKAKDDKDKNYSLKGITRTEKNKRNKTKREITEFLVMSYTGEPVDPTNLDHELIGRFLESDIEKHKKSK